MLLGTLGLGLVAALVFTGGGAKNRDVTLTFVGFSNYDRGWPDHKMEMHAWFWFTNGARPSLHWFQSVSRKIGDHWVGGGGVGPWIHERVPAAEGFQILDPPHQAQLRSFKVDDVKSPMRIVVLVQERSGGLAGMKEKWQQWDNDHWHKKSEYVAHGRRYSVTNEFWPER